MMADENKREVSAEETRAVEHTRLEEETRPAEHARPEEKFQHAEHTRPAEHTQPIAEELLVDYLEKARELADSYSVLLQRRDWLRQQYEESAGWFYTRDEIIYKLSQGAHEQSERVQTSGTSNPVERTVLNCDKVLASMNREVQTQRTEQFLEPYYRTCEEIELFEVGLRSLRGQTRLVAEQLYVDGKKLTEITGLSGNLLSRRTVEREKEAALQGIADVLKWRDKRYAGNKRA